MCDLSDLVGEILCFAFEGILDLLCEIAQFLFHLNPLRFICHSIVLLMIGGILVKVGVPLTIASITAFALCWPIGWGVACLTRKAWKYFTANGRQRSQELKARIAADVSRVEV